MKVKIYRRENKERGSQRREERVLLCLWSFWCMLLIKKQLALTQNVCLGFAVVVYRGRTLAALHLTLTRWQMWPGSRQDESSQNQAVHAESLMPALEYFPSFIFSLTPPFIPSSQDAAPPCPVAFSVHPCEFCLVVVVLLSPSWQGYGVWLTTAHCLPQQAPVVLMVLSTQQREL